MPVLQRRDRYREYRFEVAPPPEPLAPRQERMARWGVVFGILAGFVLGIIAWLSWDHWRDGRIPRPLAAIVIGWIGVGVLGVLAVASLASLASMLS